MVTSARGRWLTELYHAHSQAVSRYCSRFLKNEADAADAMHEVFIRSISSLNADPRSRQARSWLLTVAQNYCLDLVRRQRRMDAALTNLAAEPDRVSHPEVRVGDRQLLQAVLAELNERERTALWQSAVERRTLGEIAAGMGLTYMAAAQMLHRARRHASIVAARLAAILGLAGAGILRRRSLVLNATQTAAVLAIVPLVAAVAIIAASAGQSRSTAEPGRSVGTAVSGKPSTGTGAGAAGGAEAAATTSEDAGLRHVVGRLLPDPVRDNLRSTLGQARQVIRQVKKAVPSVPPVSPSVPVLPSMIPTPTALPTPPPLPKLSV